MPHEEVPLASYSRTRRVIQSPRKTLMVFNFWQIACRVFMYSIMNGTRFVILFVPTPVGETNWQGQVIYDNITVETSNTQDSTPPPEDE